MSNPVFIIGAPRSGTTLLRLMLTSHSDICIPPESLFFITLESKYGDMNNLLPQIENFLNDLYSKQFPKFCEWNVDRVLLSNNLKGCQKLSYASAVETVYQTYLQQFSNKALIWGDKNPCHIHSLEKVWRYFPKSKVILIVRDFRACYSSMKNIVVKEQQKSKKVWSGPRTLEGMMYQWNQVVNLIDKYSHKQEQFYLIYYENLIQDASFHLTKICKWLGIEFQDLMLKFYQKNIELNLVLPSQAVLNPNTFKPIDVARINAWQYELSFVEIQVIESMNRQCLQRLGYKCT